MLKTLIITSHVEKLEQIDIDFTTFDTIIQRRWRIFDCQVRPRAQHFDWRLRLYGPA